MRRAIRVIHVEDDRAIADMYALGLQLQGFEVLQASNGRTGVELALSQGADCLVVDIGLPDWDGIEVVRRLRTDARTAAVPILFLTAFDPLQYSERALELGVERILLKSHTPPAILADAIRQGLRVEV